MTMQSSIKTSFAHRAGSYQPSKTLLAWACVMTAVATMIVGFSWGGWVTGGTSRSAAATAGDVARGELASAICVERFKAAPDATAKLGRVQSDTGQLQEAAVRGGRRLGDHAWTDDARQARRGRLYHRSRLVLLSAFVKSDPSTYVKEQDDDVQCQKGPRPKSTSGESGR